MWYWDEEKRQATLVQRGIDFSTVMGLDLAEAVTRPDLRRDYGEPRFRALGLIGGRLHAVVFTPRDGRLRLISMRKANRREERIWENR